MNTFKNLVKIYFKGYRLISQCDYNPEADIEIFCLIHKSKIPIDFVKKDHQYWLLSVNGYKILKQYGYAYLIK